MTTSYAQFLDFTVPSQATFKAGQVANITWSATNRPGQITVGIFLYRYGKSDVPVGSFQSANFTDGFINYAIPNDTAYGCSYYACMDPKGAAGIFVCTRASQYFCIEGGPAGSIPQDFPLTIVGTFDTTVVLPGMWIGTDGEGKYVQTCNSLCANVQALGSLNIGNGTAQLSIVGFMNGPCYYPNMTIVMTLLSPFRAQQPPSQANQASVQVFIYIDGSKTSSEVTTGCMTYSTPAISYTTKSYGYNFHIDTITSTCSLKTTLCGAGWFTIDGSASLDYTKVLSYLSQLASNISGQTIFIGLAIAVGIIIAFIAIVIFILYCISSSNKQFAGWLSENAGVEFDDVEID